MSQHNDLEAQLAELQARQHTVRQLVASQGWRELTVICEGAVTGRRQTAFARMAAIRSTENCFELANLGSEIAGMQFVLALPHVMLKDIEQDIQRVIVERRETEDGTT